MIPILDHILYMLEKWLHRPDRDAGAHWNLLCFLSGHQQQAGTFYTQIHSSGHSVDAQTLWEQLPAWVWVQLWNIWAQNTPCRNAHCTGKSLGWPPIGCGHAAPAFPICEIPKGPWGIWIVSHNLLLFCHIRRPRMAEACCALLQDQALSVL